MSFAIALSDEQWELVADLFDPPGRRGPLLGCRPRQVDAAPGPPSVRGWPAYWAWIVTPSGYCLGIAGRNGELFASFYADDGPPGPLDEDGRWHGEDDRSLDWDGR